MGLFKTRQNKKYSYTPRYYKNNGEEGSPYAIKHKFDEYRTITVGKHNLKSKLNHALSDLKEKDPEVNRRILIIIAVLVLIFLFIIDFDLSIFFS